jgi:hypothetical protein
LEALAVPHITSHYLVFKLEYYSTVCMFSSCVWYANFEDQGDRAHEPC